jgi:class 3 adenylate cyclase/tetratricopeptide (TPR) repeat protein
MAAAAGVDERKLVTVLFADLVGSTALGSGEDPERIRAMLDRFYDGMAAEIEAAGGTVEKFAGDAVMAAFGAPDALEDHAERALHAALAMRRRLKALFGDDLALRIGVNSGEVVVGRPREGGSFVTGDAVNVGARLEQAAEREEILVGERTASLVRGAFEFGPTRRVEAKGKEGGVMGAPLVRALGLMRPRGVSGLSSAFVGREEELDLLLATYARAVRQGGPHLVTIMASAGVGKTRLLRELWQRLGDERPEPLRRTGRCLAYGRGITYWALGEVLREHFDILESDPPETAVERLGDRRILGLALGLDVGADLHPIAARDHLQAAWVELLEELAQEQPVVLLIEDINWADDALLDLLGRLAREVRGPVLIIVTARPELLESRPAWGGGLRNSSLLWLEPLQSDDAGRLLEELLGTTVPAWIREMVIPRAEGNPFFVEELLGTLIDRGLLERRDGTWHIDELPAGFEIPDTVQAVVAARVDLLPATAKAALQAAAVCGRTFWAGAVRDLLDGAEPDFQVLEDRDFIRRRPGSGLDREVEYAIKHALTREVAYATVPKARRARLHARYGEWLERTGGGRAEHVALLAHHYAEAVRPDAADLAWGDDLEAADRLLAAATGWLQRAGEAAVARYEIDEAIELFERALDYTEDPNARAMLFRSIGRANALGFRGREFWEAMERSLELTDDPIVQGETYTELGYQTSLRGGMWSRAPDQQVVSGWIERALELTSPDSRARVKALYASVFWEVRRERVNDHLLARADEAVRLADELDEPELRSEAYVARAVSAFRSGRYEEAYDWASRPLAFVQSLTDPERVSEVYEILGQITAMLGRFDEARATADVCAELNERLSPHHRVHGVAIAAEIEEVAANWDALRELTASIEQRVEANGATFCIRNPRTLLVCAGAHLVAGDRREAERLEEKAGAMTTEGWELPLGAPRLRLALLRRDLEEVHRLVDDLGEPFGRILPIVGVPAYLSLRLDALVSLGDVERLELEIERQPELTAPLMQPFVLRARGRMGGRRELVEEAVARFEALGLAWHAQQTRELL